MRTRFGRLVESRRRATSRPLDGAARARRAIAGLVGVALASVLAAMFLSRAADARASAERSLRIDTQSLERRLGRLDAPGAEDTLTALAESRDGVRVRLVEALDRAREGAAGGDLRHRIDPLPTGVGESTVILRLTIEGRVTHGAALLALLADVQTAGTPWPTEVRGCSLERVDAGAPRHEAFATHVRLPALLVRCAVDLLHWREPASA